MFLVKHPGNRHLFKFQPKTISSLEKPHVSDKAPGKSPFVKNLPKIILCSEKPHVSGKAPGISPFVQISAQNHFEFGKITCFCQSTRNIAICPNFNPKPFRVWKNHMFLTKHPEYRHLSKFQPKMIPSLEKPHVSDKAPGKSPFVQISAPNDFEFGKTTCF